MTDLVIMKDRQAVTTSLQVAEGFNKRHTHVIEAIENKIHSAENSAQYKNMFIEGTYQDKSGKTNKLFYMNRDGFSFIAFGFTGRKADEFKLKYIDAFNQMEDHIKQQVKIPTTPRDLALLALSAGEETNQRVDDIDVRLTDIEENKLITTEDKGTVDSHVRKKVYQICKEHHFGQDAKSMLFQDLGLSIKQLFQVPNRGRIKDKDFSRVLEFIDNWQPSSVTKEQIKQLEFDFDIE
ncbi:Rha family transcriptional regulator [Enterococcus devriesei]|uniref:Rha family transcriptional regulator n=1 Tax=Enterococcus devriesei TaxID=319970 RepID=UPI0028E1CFF9|nr:Rha family transcriptional regulator [Enterococcus devriesei]